MTKEQIENNFRYHAPTGDQIIRYGRLRNYARELSCGPMLASLETNLKLNEI